MILVLRVLGVGDLATAVPALRGLRSAFPQSELALAAPPWLAPLVDLVGGIDRLIPVAGLDAGNGLPSPDLAINLHGRGPQSHRLLQAARPSRLWAFACPAAGHLNGPLWSTSEHEVRRWCRLVGWYGVTTDPADLRLHRPRPDPVPVGTTIVHPGAKTRERRWPPRRFAAVARELTNRGHWVVVTGSAGEKALAEEVAARAGLPGTAVLAGRTSLTDLAALVAHARLLISGDTGIGHLATAYGTASVLLFGPVSPAQWGPPPERPWHRALWPVLSSAPSPSPSPGARHPHPALMAVDPAQVLAAADEVEQVRRRAAALH
jgi:ADP-heptose:LPS heptosyltransferase